jgi:hypothetical protein
MPHLASCLGDRRPGVDRFQVRALLERTFAAAAPATFVSVAAASAQGLLARGHDQALIDGLIDRLVAQMPVGAFRPSPPQPPADLRRRPALAEPASDRGTQLLLDSDPSRSWALTPQVSLPLRIPRLVAAVGLAVAGDLAVDALVALADSGRDRLHGLPSGEPVSDLDPVVLGEVAAADRLIDKGHRASIYEPQGPTAQRHTHPPRSSRSTRPLSDQLKVAALRVHRRLVPRSLRHRKPFRSGFATTPRNRPVYPVIFIDAMVVKVRDGQVANKPVYVVIGVTVDGERDILGLWAGDGGEGAKFWLSVFTEIKNRGGQGGFRTSASPSVMG